MLCTAQNLTVLTSQHQSTAVAKTVDNRGNYQTMCLGKATKTVPSADKEGQSSFEQFCEMGCTVQFYNVSSCTV